MKRIEIGKLIMYLTPWQKKQAALLYHFSSSSYLEGLRDRVRALRLFAENLLDENEVKGRDRFLHSKRWGARDTGENWANNAWPFLGDFQKSIAQSIADHRSNIYHKTGAHQCARGISESSVQWMVPEEQHKFDSMFEELTMYAWYIDETMDRATLAARWDDFSLRMAWQDHAEQFLVIPRFRALSAVQAESGEVPARTGVYMSIDDPNAALQFAWNGAPNGRLLNARTFNDTGKAALATVGRAGLWIDGPAMLCFVLANSSNHDLYSDPFFNDSQTPDLAPPLVARNAFTSLSSRWCYVELMEGEFEEIEQDAEAAKSENMRFNAGEHCLSEGFYFSPANPNSRQHFRVGDRFPDLGSTYGKTIWQVVVD